MTRIPLLLWLLCLTASAWAAEPLAKFEVRDYLGHSWQDELIHFDFAVTTKAKDLTLVDAAGKPVPCQVTDLQRDTQKGTVAGKVWTVVSLQPGGVALFALREGKPPAATGVEVARGRDQVVLRNDRLVLYLPQWPGNLAEPMGLPALPAPLRAVSAPQGPELGRMQWFNDGEALGVKQATTTVVEAGAVRAIVEQALVFTDGRKYRMTITLAAKQDAALITEDSDVDHPRAGLRFSLVPGLGANHALWNNQWKETEHAKSYALTDTAVDFTKAEVLCRLRPWSFWWLGDLTAWAGFYREGEESWVGVLALRPSRWSPPGWEGFDRTEIPVNVGPGPRLDLTFALLAVKQKEMAQNPEGDFFPLHREWAITVGKVADNLPSEEGAPVKLRRQLIKYSEFPLDEVKDYRFDFTPAQPDRKHPFLLFTDQDIERVRRQVEKIPSLKQEVDEAVRYCTVATNAPRTLEQEGWEAFYRKNYIGNYMVEKLPTAYIGTDDPVFGKLMAAAVQGLTQELLNAFLETPSRPQIGAYGPWFSETVTRLLFAYDLIAGKGLLTPAEESKARAALVFGAHFLSHPDYWNTDRGLCSANPNMTSSILLPRGLCALLLDGHPRAPEWLKGAEEQLKAEMRDWVYPGGAWIECPGYQAASLDGEFLLAQALKNVLGRDYFLDPKFQATMDYYGFLLTPPDRRFPPRNPNNLPAPMVIPSIGDMFSGWITCFNGWMACATAKTDPEFSARQQFFWQMQNYYLGSAGRAKGLSLALTDPELPATPPSELSAAFPGFGSVMRTSWTEPAASYLCHRTGPTVHHYHDDHGEIIYAAKGATLVTDFGNCYAPVHRRESWYHNRVSWDKGDSPNHYGTSGELKETRFLPRTVDYSFGRSRGSGNQQSDRHLLLIKSADPLGANYVVVRDVTQDGQPNQVFYWNLWVLAAEPEVGGSVVHFPGQNLVDLDVHVLSPTNPQIEKDHWSFEQYIYVWGPFKEEQWAMRVPKSGSAEDYFCVLYPRAAGQGAAQVQILAGGAGAQVEHVEGTDVVLLSPGKPAEVATADFSLSGEIAIARRYAEGRVRLAVVKAAQATLGGWGLNAPGPVAVEIAGRSLQGESNGAEAQTVVLTLPEDYGEALVTVDGKEVAATREGRALTLNLPAGKHEFAMQAK